MKTTRHNKILELINKYPITTQEELIEHLRSEGYDVTQSTVSRDIKQLRLTKTLLSDGKYRYQASPSAEKGAKNNFQTIFSSSVISIETAMNIIVVKTFSGMAQAACAALDMMSFDRVVGTLAGEDTIIVVCRDPEEAEACAEEFDSFLS
ncbi:MAG: arginine repressor [Ruminococcus sp.]|uniref:arginine repressor n=1 Tax=Ruminococcus sp. TaxID=41978 RepID=UPI00287303BB|nr:arginine repressor [Ruminococcus sp.]MBQ3286192.1 arginine repressor [Ruminococcus sp.]